MEARKQARRSLCVVVEAALHGEAKAAAALEGVTLQDWVVRLVQDALRTDAAGSGKSEVSR